MTKNLALLSLIGLVACAQPSLFKPFAGRFPSRAELDTLKTAPATEIPSSDSSRHVARYTPVTVAQPGAYTPAEYREGWAQPFVEIVNRSQGRIFPSRGMRCLAEELGRFQLEHGGRATRPLENHLAGHCGVSEPGVRTFTYGGRTDPSLGGDALAEEWGAAMVDGLRQASEGGMFLGGFWYGRKGNDVTFVGSFVQRRSHLEAIDAREGTLTLRGQVMEAYDRMTGMITQGAYGVARCARNMSVMAPHFEFACPISAEDPSAWVEIVGFEPGRFLGNVVVLHQHRGPSFDPTYLSGVELEPEPPMARVAPEGAAPQDPSTPAKPLVATATPAPDGQGDARAPQGASDQPDTSFDEAVFRLINAWRAKAGLAAMALELNQSATNRDAAPHYYTASFGGEAALAPDIIAMGLMAGWDVTDTVSRGHFTNLWQSFDSSPAVFVETMLQTPHDRETILSKDAQRLAVGTVKAAGGIGALITSYQLYGGTDREALTASVLEKLNAARASRGRPPMRLDGDATREAHMAAKGIEDPNVDPNDALRVLNSRIVQVTRMTVLTWTLTMVDPEEIDFPAQLLDSPANGVGMSVAFYRDADAPWGQYYIIVSVLGDGRSA